MVDTNISNGIQKLLISQIPISVEPFVIGQDLVTSVRETSREGIFIESLKPLHMISLKEIITGAACGSAQVDRIFRTPSRAIHMKPRVNIEFFSPSRGSNSSFAKWSRNIDPLNTAIDGSLTQEHNSTSFCFDKISAKCLPGEFFTDLDRNKRMNLASSVLGKRPKFIDFGLSSFNATSKPNSVLSPSTRAEILNGTEGGILNGDWITSSHGFERDNKKKA